MSIGKVWGSETIGKRYTAREGGARKRYIESGNGRGRARSLFTDKKRIYVNGSAFGGSDEGGLALGLVLQLRAFGKMQYSNNSESGSYPPD